MTYIKSSDPASVLPNQQISQGCTKYLSIRVLTGKGTKGGSLKFLDRSTSNLKSFLVGAVKEVIGLVTVHHIPTEMTAFDLVQVLVAIIVILVIDYFHPSGSGGGNTTFLQHPVRKLECEVAPDHLSSRYRGSMIKIFLKIGFSERWTQLFNPNWNAIAADGEER